MVLSDFSVQLMVELHRTVPMLFFPIAAPDRGETVIVDLIKACIRICHSGPHKGLHSDSSVFLHLWIHTYCSC
jgi:hypothetical protein